MARLEILFSRWGCSMKLCTDKEHDEFTIKMVEGDKKIQLTKSMKHDIINQNNEGE